MTGSNQHAIPSDQPPLDLRGQLLDFVGEAVIATDPDGIIIYWNHEAESLYGYSAHEVLGCSVYDITVPAASQSQADEIMHCLRAGESWSGEFEVQRRNGESFMAQVTTVPVTGEGGALRAIVGVSSDITERREAERQREERIRQLIEANEAKDAFLGLLSHELKRPLSYLLGHAEILNKYKGRLDQETAERSLLDIREGVRHLDRIISDLLVLARPEAGDEIDLESVPLHNVVEQVVREHGRQYGERRVETVAEEGLPPALAQSVYVEHILRNLLHNAEKYSPADKPILIRIEADNSGKSIRVSLEDHGEGIAEGEFEKVFEVFYRSPATRSVEGTGVGLAVCKRLVELQQGEIWAEPAAKGGTAFHFTLPVAPG